ncbi:hypothetical protein [Burkholderia contaminans]|nr:hypothetical protein [Burkholderia contaminans]
MELHLRRRQAFHDDRPDIHALEYLLSNTHASADFTVVGNQLMKR